MSLEPIQFVKNWNRNTNTREINWDEIANKTAAYSLRLNNKLKQFCLDIGGVYITTNISNGY